MEGGNHGKAEGDSGDHEGNGGLAVMGNESSERDQKCVC